MHDTDRTRVSHARVMAAATSMLERGSASFVEQRAEDALMQLWCFVTFFVHGLQDSDHMRPCETCEVEPEQTSRMRRELLCRMREVWTRIAVLTAQTKAAAPSHGHVADDSPESDLATISAVVQLQALWEAELHRVEMSGEAMAAELQAEARLIREHLEGEEAGRQAAEQASRRLEGVVDELKLALVERHAENGRLREALSIESAATVWARQEATRLAAELDDARRQVIAQWQ